MSVWSYCLAACCMFLAAVSSVDAVQCYNCSSVTDPNCGQEFGYSGANDAANITCTGLACKKQMHTDSHKGILIVYRNCFDGNETKGLPEMGCDPYMTVGEVCYCTGELCNGQPPLHVNIFMLLTLMTPLVLHYFN